MTKKIEKIIDLLNQLYCFNDEEISEYTDRIPYISKKGLKELERTLKEGLIYQNKMIEGWIEREPEFASKLNTFIDKTSANLLKEHEAIEQASAENILAELE